MRTWGRMKCRQGDVKCAKSPVKISSAPMAREMQPYGCVVVDDYFSKYFYHNAHCKCAFHKRKAFISHAHCAYFTASKVFSKQP